MNPRVDVVVDSWTYIPMAHKVEALWDGAEPTPIRTAFCHCVLTVLRVFHSWELLSCWNNHYRCTTAAFSLRALFVGHTTKPCSGFPDRTHQNIEALNKRPSAAQAWIFTTSISIHAFHVNMSSVLLQSPRRAELFPMRSTATTASQFLAWRAVNCQTEEVARFAKISVPVAVCDEVNES